MNKNYSCKNCGNMEDCNPYQHHNQHQHNNCVCDDPCKRKKGCMDSDDYYKCVACQVSKKSVIVGKEGEERPNVCYPCQGMVWFSSDYQTEYIFNKGEWHLVNPQAACAKELVNYIFKNHTIEEVQNDFNAFIFGTDGTMSIDSEGLLVVANPFTATIPLGNEHPKNLRYWNSPFTLSDDYEIRYEAELAVQQYIDINMIPDENMKRRIRNVDEDIRLCSGAINTLDPETWTVFDIFFSNEKIYCFVERLPFGQTDENKYAAYSAGVHTILRTGDPYNDFVKVAIGLKKSTAHFYINDVNVFNVPRIGVRESDQYRLLDHQGSAQSIKINSSYFGFGLFSLLDMQLPYNYSRQKVNDDFGDNISASGLVQIDNTSAYGESLPGQSDGDDRPIIDPSQTWAVTLNQYPDNNKSVKLFGQGAALRIKYFKVCEYY